MSTNKTSENNIKYVLIANAHNEKIIGEYTSNQDSSWKKIAQKVLFDNCKNNENKYNKNMKFPTQDGVFYCKLSQNMFFYIALVSEKYSERLAFNLLEDLIKDNIHLLIDAAKGELNQHGLKALKALALVYNNNNNYNQEEDKLSSLNGDINDIKIEMQNNVKKVLANTDDLNSLDAKSVRIKDNANLFKKDAVNLARKTFWENFKWKLVFVFMFILLVVYLGWSLFSGGDDNKSAKDSGNQVADKHVPNNANLSFLK